jgi:hypothetical protein
VPSGRTIPAPRSSKRRRCPAGPLAVQRSVRVAPLPSTFALTFGAASTVPASTPVSAAGPAGG